MAGRIRGARKKAIDGIVFDSTKEAYRYVELKHLAREGKIRDLKVHNHPDPELRCEKYFLAVNGRPVKLRSKGYPNGRRASYTPDFTYREEGPDLWELVIEDVKGYDSYDMRFKRAVVEAMLGQQIRVT